MKKVVFLFLLIAASALIAAPNIGIQNVLQLPYSLESITGVSNRTKEISEYYTNHKLVFPKQGSVDEVSAPYLFSQISYTSLFCKKMIDKDSKLPVIKRWAHRNLDFSQSSLQWSLAIKKQQLDEYALMFWQRPLDPAEQTELLDLFDQLIADQAAKPEGNNAVLMGLCTVFGSSFSFLSI